MSGCTALYGGNDTPALRVGPSEIGRRDEGRLCLAEEAIVYPMYAVWIDRHDTCIYNMSCSSVSCLCVFEAGPEEGREGREEGGERVTMLLPKGRKQEHRGAGEEGKERALLIQPLEGEREEKEGGAEEEGEGTIMNLEPSMKEGEGRGEGERPINLEPSIRVHERGGEMLLNLESLMKEGGEGGTILLLEPSMKRAAQEEGEERGEGETMPHLDTSIHAQEKEGEITMTLEHSMKAAAQEEGEETMINLETSIHAQEEEEEEGLSPSEKVLQDKHAALQPSSSLSSSSQDPSSLPSSPPPRPPLPLLTGLASSTASLRSVREFGSYHLDHVLDVEGAVIQDGAIHLYDLPKDQGKHIM